MTDAKAHIARQIKAYREERRWSQDELGSMLDNQKSGGAVSSWEIGRTTPDPETLLNLCRVFHVDISDFYPSNDRDAGDEHVQNLVNMYKKMGGNGRVALLACAKGLVETFPADADATEDT